MLLLNSSESVNFHRALAPMNPSQKEDNMMRKTFCLFLAIALRFSFAACADGGKNPGSVSDTSAGTNPAGTQPEADENEKTYFEQAWDAQGKQTFDGMSFKILSPDPGAHFYNFSGPEENEVYYETSSAEALSNSIYMRNLKTEENLGIKIEPVWGGDPGNISTTVKNNSAAGDRESFNVVLTRTDNERTAYF